MLSRNDWAKLGVECNSKLAMKIRSLSTNCKVPNIESCEGKHKYQIQIEQLLASGLTKREIAFRLGLSVKTLDRRMVEFSLSKHTPTAEAELEQAVSTVMEDYPSTGETMLKGHLLRRYII